MGNCFGCSSSTEEKKKKEEEDEIFAPLYSPLHIAVQGRDHEIVKMLLERGADANARDFEGKTPLMLACEFGYGMITMILLLFDCDIWMAEDVRGWTALHYAVFSEDMVSVRLLVSCLYSDLSRLPLSKRDAARSKLSEFIDKEDYSGLTALHLAVYTKHVDCTRLMLDLHADASPKTFGEGAVCSFSSSCSQPIWPYQAVMSILRLGREQGMSYSSIRCDYCRQGTASVTAQGCGHAFCTFCAVYICTNQIRRQSFPLECPVETEEIEGFKKRCSKQKRGAMATGK